MTMLTNLVAAPSSWSVSGNASKDTSTTLSGTSIKLGAGTSQTSLATSPTITLPVVGHIYYACYWYYAPSGAPTSSDCRYEVYGGDGTGKNWVIARNSIQADAWTRRSARWTVTAVNASSYYLRTFTVKPTYDCWCDQFMLIDLTADFGAGNEPSQDEMDAVPYFTGSTSWSASPTWTLTNLSTLSDAISLTGTTSTSEVVQSIGTATLHTTHTYYFRMSAYCDTAGVTFGMYWPIAEPGMDGKIAITSSNASTWVTASWTSVRNGNSSWTDGTAYSWRVDFNNLKNAATGQIRQVMIVDLTEAFGAGSEPSVSWMDKIPFFSGSFGIWQVVPGDVVSASADMTLYAVWGRIIPSVTPNPVNVGESILVSVEVEEPS